MGPSRSSLAVPAPLLAPLIAPLLALSLVVSACSGGAEEAADAGASGPPSSAAPSGSPAAPSASPSEAPPSPSEAPPRAASPAPVERVDPDPVSLPAYFAENRDYRGGGLRVGAVRERTGAYTSYDATYRSEGLAISGVLNVPTGRGPFPAVVLAHGYIDPDVYVRGQGMTRERGVLASRGFVAFHVDYRAHGQSDGSEERAERNLRLGYVADVVNAASALRRSDDVPVDDDRVAIFGRSMGGGVMLRALSAAPGAFDAGVGWASVSSREDDNFTRFTAPDRDEVASYIVREHGAPGTPRGRDFWPQVSARPFFDRVTEPVLLVHGTADDTCPLAWARESQRALRAAGADSTLELYEDGHAFGPAFLPAMDRTIAFLVQEMGA